MASISTANSCGEGTGGDVSDELPSLFSDSELPTSVFCDSFIDFFNDSETWLMPALTSREAGAFRRTFTFFEEVPMRDRKELEERIG